MDVDPRSVPGESGNTSSVGQADLPGRTPAFSEASGVSPSATGLPGEIQFAPFETDSALVVHFAKFYEKALRAYRIGVDRGCFPKEFKDSEFYPLFIELATLFTNRAECVAGEVSEILPLVEVNATTVRVNAWVLFCGRFRSVYRNPETDEEDPANLLTKRVEKFLKPFVQVHPNSFLSRFRGEDGRETEEPFSSDYSVVFTDALTVNAVNFLVRAVDMPSADVQLYFKNLYDATHENEADEKFRSDQNFGFRNAELRKRSIRWKRVLKHRLKIPREFPDNREERKTQTDKLGAVPRATATHPVKMQRTRKEISVKVRQTEKVRPPKGPR